MLRWVPLYDGVLFGEIFDHRIISADQLAIIVKIGDEVGIPAQGEQLLIRLLEFDISLVECDSVFFGEIHYNRTSFARCPIIEDGSGCWHALVFARVHVDLDTFRRILGRIDVCGFAHELAPSLFVCSLFFAGQSR